MKNCSLYLLSNFTALYVALVIVLLATLYYVLKNKRLPPGPIGVPFLGYWPFLDTHTCPQQLHKLGKKYGDVFSFTCTGRLFINLGSIKSMREALINKSECFTDRLEENNIIHYFADGSVNLAKGEKWVALRKFYLRQLKDRSRIVLQQLLDGPVYDIAREIVADLKKTNGKPVNIISILLPKCSSLLRKILFGEDGMTEEEMHEFNNGYYAELKCFTSKNLLASGNISNYFVVPYSEGIKDAKKGSNMMEVVVQKVINRRKSTYDENHVRDIVDAFYKERHDRTCRNDPTAKFFTDEILLHSLTGVISDGFVLTSFVVGEFVKALLNYPEEQSKIYEELIEEIGENRDPTLEDKSKLVHTNSFILEVIRTSDVFPILPTNVCTKETTVAGYRIPKRSVLLTNFLMANMNPADFEEPEKFNSSRYIVKKGEKRPELPMLFGLGKRSCIGEGVVMTEIFLFLTTIVKNFHLTKPTNTEEETYRGIYVKYSNLYICAQARNET